MTYCEYINTVSGEAQALHREYHDNHYGFPVKDDNLLFERLMFEINQAGLNWILILRKQHNFRSAFDNYNIEKVASYGDKDFERLMNDEGIIRNKLKVEAAIDNANILLGIREEHGSFRQWLDDHSVTSASLEDWTKLFRKTFRFTGREIVNEFLVSTGYLPGAHSIDCAVYQRIQQARKGLKPK